MKVEHPIGLEPITRCLKEVSRLLATERLTVLRVKLSVL